jgi:hypothetical protein
MYRSLVRRATAAAVVLIAMLWLAAGPAAATPPFFGPSAPAAAKASFLDSLWSWWTGLWAAEPEISVEKTATSPAGDPTTDVNPSDLGDKGVLIDPNGHR